MKKIAEVRNGAFVRVHLWPDEAVISTTKLDSDGGPIFRAYTETAQPVYNPLMEKVVGSLTVNQSAVLEVWNKIALTAQEISNSKDAEVDRLNTTERKALLQLFLALANDNRAIKRKINLVISAAALATPPFPAAQATTPTNDWTEQDLKAYIKGLLL